jgi:hypothetical protein
MSIHSFKVHSNPQQGNLVAIKKGLSLFRENLPSLLKNHDSLPEKDYWGKFFENSIVQNLISKNTQIVHISMNQYSTFPQIKTKLELLLRQNVQFDLIHVEHPFLENTTFPMEFQVFPNIKQHESQFDPICIKNALFATLRDSLVSTQKINLVISDLDPIRCKIESLVHTGLEISKTPVCLCHLTPIGKNCQICSVSSSPLENDMISDSTSLGNTNLSISWKSWFKPGDKTNTFEFVHKIDLNTLSESFVYGSPFELIPDGSSDLFHVVSQYLFKNDVGFVMVSKTNLETGETVPFNKFYVLMGNNSSNSLFLRAIAGKDEYILSSNFEKKIVNFDLYQTTSRLFDQFEKRVYDPLKYENRFHERIDEILLYGKELQARKISTGKSWNASSSSISHGTKQGITKTEKKLDIKKITIL